MLTSSRACERKLESRTDAVSTRRGQRHAPPHGADRVWTRRRGAAAAGSRCGAVRPRTRYRPGRCLRADCRSRNTRPSTGGSRPLALCPGQPAYAGHATAQSAPGLRLSFRTAEVYQRIPGHGETPPEGPHTHVLPHLLRHQRTHPATAPIPDGWVPCLSLYPANPIYDAFGHPRPFDRPAYETFQTLLRSFGDPTLVRLKEAVTEAVRADQAPDGFAIPSVARWTHWRSVKRFDSSRIPMATVPCWRPGVRPSTVWSRPTSEYGALARQHASAAEGGVMTFEEMLDQALAMLQRRGRVTYRALKLQLMQSLQGERTRERFGVAAFPAVLSRAYLARALAERGVFDEGDAARTRSHPDGRSARSPVQPHLGVSGSRVSQQRQGGPEPGRPPARTRGRALPRVEHHDL